MSSSFTIETFERYLNTVRDELPPVRKYFRGQSKRASSGYRLLFRRSHRPIHGRCGQQRGFRILG